MARGISFSGLSPDFITYKAHGALTTADEGKAVTLVADGTAGLGADGDPLLGMLVKVELGYCTVHTGDYVEVPYTGTAPTIRGKVVVDGAGRVKDALFDTIANGLKGRGEVTTIDAPNLKVTIRLD